MPTAWEATKNGNLVIGLLVLGVLPFILGAPMSLSEKSLIRQIRQLSGSDRTARIPLAIGDDTAILRFPAGHEVLVTTDFSLEGVHFRRDWHPPGSVGHRCLARGLSDIAAMGGQPVAAFLSLALPSELPQRWADGFIKGLLTLANQSKVALAGGDTAQSPGKGSSAKILADIVVVGSAPRGKAIRRSGAKAGDLIYVTGKLGASVLALAAIRAQPKKKLHPGKFPAHFYPQPRVAVGLYLRKLVLATAMLDLSDGLSTDLDHLCQESNTGALVSADLLPRAKGATLEQVLHGGEDYELLFTASAGRRVPRVIAGVPVTRIGQIQQRRRGATNVWLLDDAQGAVELAPRGWEHFVNSDKS